MPSDIDSFVTDNRRRINRTKARFTAIDLTQENTVFLGGHRVELSVDTTVEYRTQGSGDPWSTANTTRLSGTVVRRGLSFAANASIGDALAPASVAYGDGNDAADVADTSLSNRLGDGTIQSDTRMGETVAFLSSVITGTSFASNDFEVAIENPDGILSREVLQTSDVTTGDEIRFRVELTVEGFGSGNSVITTTGEGRIAESLRNPYDALRIYKYTDDAFQVDKSQGTFPNESFRNTATTDTNGSKVTATTRIDSTEINTSSLPIDLRRVGVTDVSGNTILLSPVQKQTITTESRFSTQTVFSFETP